MLLDIYYDIQNVLENNLTERHKVFLIILRAADDSLPPIADNHGKTGRVKLISGLDINCILM
jgi:hypothetical protein